MAAAAAKSLQSCPTLCDPIDGSPPGSPIPGILQARTLEWVAISFSIAWKWKVNVKSLSRVWLLATPWTAAYQAPPSMGFARQEYGSGVPLPTSTNSKVPLHPSPILQPQVYSLCLWVCFMDKFIYVIFIYYYYLFIKWAYEASLHTKLVEVMEFQLSYFKS